MRQVLALLALFSLTACGGGTALTLAMLGADGLSYATTGKSLTGNVVTAAMGRDCEPFNVLNSKSMCSDDRKGEPGKAETLASADKPPVYCYRTLGQVACHSEPDPWMSPNQRLYRPVETAEDVRR
jgi:hypothetical protein